MKTKPMHDYELITRKQAHEDVIPSLGRLQEWLDDGATVNKLDGTVWLTASDGEKICGGDDVRKLLVNLIFTVC